MDKIICFLKFGEKEHMEGLARGEMYFSNALKFRQIEEKAVRKLRFAQEAKHLKDYLQ